MATAIDAESDAVAEEIELLQAIYVHEIELSTLDKRPIVVTLFLHPSTGNDDHNSKYVCLNLCLSIPGKYPFQSPGISIKNPRGLSDAHVISIQENLIALAKEKNGSPMLYDLIEYTKECLSDNNIPSCPCVICLEHFWKEEKFVKTECYHYFHSACLANYVEHFLSEDCEDQDKKIVCPMCRLDIVYNKSDYKNEDDSSCTEEVFVYKPDKKQLDAQAERQRIFEYQKNKGGIINVEEERNKYLIGIKNMKDKESGNGDLYSEGMFAKTEISQSGVSSQSTDQTCREKITEEGKKNTDTRQFRETTCNSSGPVSGRGKREKRRDTEGQKRTQLSERGGICGISVNNQAGEAKNPVVKRPGFRNENKRNEVEMRKNNESQGGRQQRRTETSRVLDRPWTQKKSKNPHSSSYGKDRKLEKSREDEEQVKEIKKLSEKDGGSHERDLEASKEQAKELSDVCWKERESTNDEVNENNTRPDKTAGNLQTRNLKEAKKDTKNEGNDDRNINNNSTVKETIIERSGKKEKHRKTSTRRGSRGDNKDCNPPVERSQKSYSSVTSGISTQRLPGFENEKADKSVGKHLKTENLSALTPQYDQVRKPTRAPPGFENIKPNNKKL